MDFSTRLSNFTKHLRDQTRQSKMSNDVEPSRKYKKAQRDADRKRKGKKRKHEEIEEDTKVEEKNEFDKDFLPLDAATVDQEVTSKKKSKSKKEKSRKRKSGEIEELTQLIEQDDNTQSTETKHKKRKKDKDASSGGQPTESEAQVDKTHRFILFVGNLPYSTTDATLRAHFKKLEPFTVRHRTDPKTGKSKGFAFLEFENYDRMKTCLKLYHHSMFDPQKAEAADVDGEAGDEKPAAKVKQGKHARRINVELTAGGGGKAEGRKEKIRVKNERLGEQRQRRAEAERKEREKKAKEEGESDAKKNVKKKSKKEEEAKPTPEGMGGIHPSRLARIAA